MEEFLDAARVAASKITRLREAPEDARRLRGAERAIAALRESWKELPKAEREAGLPIAKLLSGQLSELRLGSAPARSTGSDAAALDAELGKAGLLESELVFAPAPPAEPQLVFAPLAGADVADDLRALAFAKTRTFPADREPTPEALLEWFGLDSFRGGQREAVLAGLEGRDSLVLMPTGGGKSLCYQLPGVAHESLTIVISPLIALMQDQFRRLVEGGHPTALLASGLGEDWNADALDRIRSGEVRIVFASPERFASRSFRDALEKRKVGLFVVDEAHCLSEWGHDFRPDYLRLPKVIERLGSPPVMACTATATPKVAAEIAGRLKLRDPVMIHSGFDRPNLSFDVIPFSGTGSVERKFGILRAALAREDMRPAVVYAGTRKDVETVSERLRAEGLTAVAYHAGLDADVRRTAQSEFMSGEAQIIVATNAFGMGVDKSDIRSVFHWALPTSVEAYYQEAGRAGRDGKPARAVLLAMRADLGRLINFIKKREMTTNQVAEYLERWRNRSDRSGRLVIESPASDEERTALGIAERSNAVEVEPAGGGKLELRLIGPLDRRRSDTCCQIAKDRVWEAYKAMEKFSSTHDVCRRRQLLDHFGDDSETHPDGRCCDVCDPIDWLPSEEEIAALQISPAPSSKKGRAAKSKPAPLSDGEAAELVERLKEWRKGRAGGKPAYTVCTNDALAAIASAHPTSVEQLLTLHGIGPAFAARHSESLFAFLAEQTTPAATA